MKYSKLELFFLIFIIIIFIFSLYFFIKKYNEKENKNINNCVDYEWNIISTNFCYYYGGWRNKNFYFKIQLPTFKQILVPEKIFYSFLDEESQNVFFETINSILINQKIDKKEKEKIFFLEIESKKIKCFFKFYKIDQKTKILKGYMTNVFKY